MSGAEDDFLGYVDEFIENAAEDVVDDHSLVFEKIDNSFDSSFDNFPSDIQEKALARLDIIKFVERRLNGGWTERNLVPLIEEYKTQTNKPVPSWRILAGWRAKYVQSDRNVLALAPQYSKKGNRVRKSDSDTLIYEAIQKKYLTKIRISVAETYEYYKSRVIEENRNLIDGKIQLISKRTFYNIINKLPPYEVAVARYGKAYADREFRKVGTIIPATYPMEYVEIDHTPAPAILVDDELELPLGRPYLTILYDRYSDCIVGLYVGFRDPSYESVRSAFLNATLNKGWVRECYPNIKNEWPCGGKITNLVVDNGAEFWSASLEQALKPLVSDIIYTKAGKPWEKPHVEKAFDTFYKLLLSRMPGKTFTNITQLKDYNPKKDAVVRVSVFIELLYKWVIDYYNMKPDSKERKIPYHQWHQSKWRPNFYDGIEAEQLKIELGIVHYRTLGKDGIRLHSLRYQSDALVEYKKKSAKAYKKGVRLKIKTNPDDISHIYVYLAEDKSYLKVPVVGDSKPLKGLSLYQYQRICAVRRLNTRLQADKESLAETYLYIERRIDGEFERHIGRNKPALPKTSNTSKIAKFKKVGSEGPTSIVANTEIQLEETRTKADFGDISVDDLSDIDGY
jgi:putative transposase